jgi:hypothetical protein
MAMRLVLRCALVAGVAIMTMALAMDVSSAQKQKKHVGRVPPDACKVAGGYIPTGQACTGTTQFNMNQINWCTFGTLTPGILCAGMLCPAAKC